MQPMWDNEFDKKFQDSFEGFEVTPSASVWPAVARRLKSKKSGKRIPFFWAAAASLTIMFISGLYVFRPKTKIWLYSENDVAVKIKPQEENRQSVALELLPQKKDDGPRVALEITKSNVVRKAKINPREAEILTGDVAAIEKIATKVETHESHSPNKVAMVAIPDQTDIGRLVSLSDSVIENREITAIRPRIKSIGDIVNFVVAKVDQRDDKIIEMSDNDEGSSISAINLGVLKIKSGKNKTLREFRINFK
jgi:hypothetical protein